MRHRGARQALLAAVYALVAVACGAKTGLRLPDGASLDAGTDAFTRDALDARTDARDIVDVPLPDRCLVQRVTLLPLEADILFVLDRSTSMGWDLNGAASPPSRWTLLRNAMNAALPTFDGAMHMGGMLFPTPGGGSCDVSMTVDVRPAANNATAVLNLLARNTPGGVTPTALALQTAAAFFATQPMMGRARNVVLATDGGPNCNLALDPMTCRCSVREACTAQTCLDDVRTLEAIRALARQGVPTYVIGIAADNQPELVPVLNEMAVAGTRPNTRPGGTQFYNARQASDLQAAFTTIQHVVAACIFRVPTAPVDPAAVLISADGTSIDPDITRRSGWDWTRDDHSEITIFGPACDAIVGRTPDVVLTIPCPDR